MLIRQSFIAAFLSLFFQNQPIFGATITTTMTVSATVTNTCSFGTITNTVFGSVDGLFSSPVSVSNGSIVVICTTGDTYSIALNAGNNQITNSNRQMASGTHFIQYQLFSDPAQTTLWGDGTTGIGNTRTGLTGTGANQTYIVYAKIPSGQTPVPAGSYNDTVTITVNF